ncbi:MAG: hypothetical protein ACRD32_07625, partial [Nitrososphaerales archaeon]
MISQSSRLPVFMLVAAFLCISIITIPYAYADSPSFDKDSYGLDETATITLVDTPSGGTRDVTVQSISDATGFDLTLTEIESTGTYTGTITFSTESSNPELGILKVAVGDFIVATFGEEPPAIATITETTLELGLQFEFETYNLSSGAVGSAPVIITLTNPDANTDSSKQQFVDISVTSE